MQTSTPGPNIKQSEAHDQREKKNYMQLGIILNRRAFYLTFKTARWWLLCVTQEIQTEHLHIWLAIVGEDTGAEVVSWAQRPAARVLEKGEHKPNSRSIISAVNQNNRPPEKFF